MRIVRLQAEGFKRLVAVDITPEGDLVEVRGNNGNGKSSVLDAIFAALAGAGAAPEKPVREGEEAAVIRLDLGGLIVTRYFTDEGTTGLKVTREDGATYTSAQTMLDKLVGHISFDPLEFLHRKPAEQAEELRSLIVVKDPETGEELDLEELAAQRKAVFEERRDVNRKGRDVKGRLESMGGERHVPADAPDPADLRARLASAAETNTAISEEERRRERLQSSLEEAENEIAELEKTLADLKVKRDQLAETIDKLEPLEDRIDASELSKALEEADRIADNRRHNEARDKVREEFEALKVRSETMTSEIAALDKRRNKAIAAADMPVDGLELRTDDDGALSVWFDGVPFSQASDAERLRVSCAIAMAANPELRVLRLKDASLLDKAAVETLRGMAKENDFQIWAEFVGDEGPGIVMEAGSVRGAEKPEELPKPRRRKKSEASDDGDLPELSTGDENVNPGEKRQQAPSSGTLFDDPPAEERSRPKPRAMTEITTKPKGANND